VVRRTRRPRGGVGAVRAHERAGRGVVRPKSVKKKSRPSSRPSQSRRLGRLNLQRAPARLMRREETGRLDPHGVRRAPRTSWPPAVAGRGKARDQAGRSGGGVRLRRIDSGRSSARRASSCCGADRTPVRDDSLGRGRPCPIWAAVGSRHHDRRVLCAHRAIPLNAPKVV